MLNSLIDIACHAQGAAASILGLSPTQFALASAIMTGALAWGFLATWLFAFGRLRTGGLARRQQRLVWWFVFSVALLQIALSMGAGVGIEPIPCPWSALLMPFLAFFFLSMAYGLHVEDENKATLTKFLQLVGLPVLGEAAITAKWTVSGSLSLVAWILRHL